jgi:hypothetical protein
VKILFFLLNAAFAMTILDFISRVRLASSQPCAKQQTEHGFVYSVLLHMKFHEITSCILAVVYAAIPGYGPLFENNFFFLRD